MMRLALFLSLLVFTSCSQYDAKPIERPARAMKIVSLDYCADQYVLKLVDPSRILGVSPDAVKAFSYMRESAIGVPTIKPMAEDVILQKPDLVVRSYGGGPNATTFFEKAGIPVLNVGWANDIDGIKTVITDMAKGLGEEEKGQAIVSDMEARLANIVQSADRPKALYMTPTGVTSGSGSLIHDMLLAAGYSNFQDKPGWRSLPLERLAYEQPDVVVAAFFDSKTEDSGGWSAMRHPIARSQMKNKPIIPLQGAWTSCGSWYLLDAIEALANAHTNLSQPTSAQTSPVAGKK